MTWLMSPENPALDPGDVHVWRVALDRPEDEAARLAATLSPDERERAASLIVEVPRRRWTMARGLLRVILGRYIGIPPHEIRFRYGERGKPAIDGEREVDVRFNLAHSGELALIAVSRAREIGVDVEVVRPNRELEGIAERYFSTREATALRALPLAERTDAFYRCWTRKEAYIKAVGAGLSVPLDSFDVEFAPGAPAELLATRGVPNEPGRWSMSALDPGPGYVAALVVEGSGLTLRFFEG